MTTARFGVDESAFPAHKRGRKHLQPKVTVDTLYNTALVILMLDMIRKDTGKTWQGKFWSIEERLT